MSDQPPWTPPSRFTETALPPPTHRASRWPMWRTLAVIVVLGAIATAGILTFFFG